MRKMLIIAAALVTATLTACGTDSPESTNAGGGPKASCDLAPTSLIKETLGLDVTAPTVQENGTVLVCTYQPVPGAIDTVLVRFETASSAEQFRDTRETYAEHEMQTQDYPGFADEAYTNTLAAAGLTTNTLVARQGPVEILVSSSASFAQEQALEQKLFDALR
jgi:hypothetical protein